MNNPSVTMSPLARQSERTVFEIELRTPRDELLDFGGSFVNDQLHHLPMTKAIPGNERILDVVLEGVFRCENTCETALSIGTVTLGNSIFGGDQNGEFR